MKNERIYLQPLTQQPWPAPNLLAIMGMRDRLINESADASETYYEQMEHDYVEQLLRAGIQPTELPDITSEHYAHALLTRLMKGRAA